MSIMDTWGIGEAKQRFSEVVRRSGTEPQKIFNRDRLVAAVVSPDLLETAQNLRREESTRSLAEVFSEIREICTEENYQLEIGKRKDRKNRFAEDS